MLSGRCGLKTALYAQQLISNPRAVCFLAPDFFLRGWLSAFRFSGSLFSMEVLKKQRSAHVESCRSIILLDDVSTKIEDIEITTIHHHSPGTTSWNQGKLASSALSNQHALAMALRKALMYTKAVRLTHPNIKLDVKLAIKLGQFWQIFLNIPRDLCCSCS